MHSQLCTVRHATCSVNSCPVPYPALYPVPCASYWLPPRPHVTTNGTCSERPAKELPCVVYLHGNSSCRAGCLDSLEVVLGVGATMFALDFAGSGMSGGDYVTLGEYEKDDVAAVRRCNCPRCCL